MKKRETKKKDFKAVTSSDSHTKEIKHYIGIVVEEFQHRVSAIGEQFLGLNEKLDSHTEMIARLMIDVEEIKVNMREKIGRDEFNKLEIRLVTLESIVLSNSGKVTQNKKHQKHHA